MAATNTGKFRPDRADYKKVPDEQKYILLVYEIYIIYGNKNNIMITERIRLMSG